MNEFCDRYRERNGTRQMLALRGAKVDLTQWEAMSFSATPPSKMKVLAEKGFVVFEAATASFRRRVA